MHAIGDGANRAALNAFERTRELWQQALLRPRIEHAQCLDDADLPRFAELGVIASMQPAHATSDRDVADALWGDRAAKGLPHPRPARLRRACRVRRRRADRGARPAGRDPAPPSTARSTTASRGTRSSGSRWPTRSPCHTAAAAYAVGEERRRGCLLPGLEADLVVLDTDIVAHPERIAERRVVATMLAGRWVHGRPPW